MPLSSYSLDELEEVGVLEGIIRISAGLEDSSDNIDDLKFALNQI
jgi:cystathionine beta-lyase/cystathionine gamma-synthase